MYATIKIQFHETEESCSSVLDDKVTINCDQFSDDRLNCLQEEVCSALVFAWEYFQKRREHGKKKKEDEKKGFLNQIGIVNPTYFQNPWAIAEPYYCPEPEPDPEPGH